jgi:Ala-tRNA(Pro) deacylase
LLPTRLVGLATEREAANYFRIARGVPFPPVGECYGLDVIVDDSIDEQPEVYFEGGDHGTLVHMSHAQFANLTATARVFQCPQLNKVSKP